MSDNPLVPQRDKSKKKSASPLGNLGSIGPAMLRDLDLLGIHTLDQLKRSKARSLYERLCRLTGVRQDPCVLDTFTCAVEQAKNPRLPAGQKNWWYWSRIRKEREHPPRART